MNSEALKLNSALMELLTKRHSCRAFSREPIDDKTLQMLADAFASSPVAGGGRELACKFITDSSQIENIAHRGKEAFRAFCESIESDFIREEIADYGKNFFWFDKAPTLAVVSCRKSPAYLRHASGEKAALLWGGELSAGMAAFAMMLAAESLGLGACCLTGPIAVWREMETMLEIPERNELVILVALGGMCND